MITGTRAHNFIDKTGFVYGDITVIGLHDIKINIKGKKKSFWKCCCSCGREVIIPSGNLSSGNTKNCGCKKSERLLFYVNTILKLPKGRASFNALYSKYKYGAKKRGLRFELCQEKFEQLITNNCFYCDSIPKTIEPARGYRNGEFVYNGIDRVDNKQGYTTENCVTCCKMCNLMKHASTQDQFLEHVNNIQKNMGRKKNDDKE